MERLYPESGSKGPPRENAEKGAFGSRRPRMHVRASEEDLVTLRARVGGARVGFRRALLSPPSLPEGLSLPSLPEGPKPSDPDPSPGAPSQPRPQNGIGDGRVLLNEVSAPSPLPPPAPPNAPHPPPPTPQFSPPPPTTGLGSAVPLSACAGLLRAPPGGRALRAGLGRHPGQDPPPPPLHSGLTLCPLPDPRTVAPRPSLGSPPRSANRSGTRSP